MGSQASRPTAGAAAGGAHGEPVEEKFPKENFRVNREMREKILVYESILSNFWAKMASKCRENDDKFWILGFKF